jgi:hypothetical protein
LIYPDDIEAQQQPSGDWKYGKSITEDIERKIITVDS